MALPLLLHIFGPFTFLLLACSLFWKEMTKPRKISPMSDTIIETVSHGATGLPVGTVSKLSFFLQSRVLSLVLLAR
jgi:hypothetical protein